MTSVPSPSSLKYRPAERSFLDPDRIDRDRPEDARVCVIPFGLEASVTYGSGTGRGPEAILEASHALEHYDDEFGCEPYRAFGVATLETPPIISPLEASLAQLGALVERVAREGKFPLTLGGEHALTPGAVAPLSKLHDELVVVQIDAHADLRDGYLGEKYSHASAMRRVLDHDNVSVISFGIRSLSHEEAETMESFGSRVTTHWAREKERWDLDKLKSLVDGRPIYISFDVDAFDPSLMPATGTPEPGGLFWPDVCRLLRAIANSGTVIGADIVELAPIAGFHAYDFTVARLAYKLLTYVHMSHPPASG